MSSGDGHTFDKTTKVTLPEDSQYGPALATDGVALYLAWVGSDPQHQLNVISGDGVSFNNENKKILGESSIASPALAYGNDFYLAWTDQDKHIRIGLLAQAAGRGSAITGWNSFPPPGNLLPGQETLHGPALASWDTAIPGEDTQRSYLAYSGTEDNHFIYIMYAENEPWLFPHRRQLPDSSPPDGPALAAVDHTDFQSFHLGYVRGDNHHINLIKMNPTPP